MKKLFLLLVLGLSMNAFANDRGVCVDVKTRDACGVARRLFANKYGVWPQQKCIPDTYGSSVCAVSGPCGPGCVNNR